MNKWRVGLCHILYYVLIVLSIAVEPGFSQNTRRQLIERYLVPSYVTLLGGINLPGGHGHWDDLWFEADINQHLHFQPRFLKDKLFVKINPRVRLRMFQEDSAPVRTPSFMPNITMFFGFGKANQLYANQGFTYLSIMLSHHSNGQAGSFYNLDGSINIDTGNFSTNFFDFGINRIWGEKRLWQAWTRFSLIWHPGFNRSDELEDQYEKFKVTLTSSTFRGTQKVFGYNLELHGFLSYTISGLKYTFIPGPGSTDPPRKANWQDRINWGLSLNFGKKARGDFRWFIKYDHGYDYYNIHFWRKFRRIQFGIAADPL